MSRVRQRGLLGQQAQQRVLDDGAQRRRDARRPRCGSRRGRGRGRAAPCSRSWPTRAVSERHVPGVVAQQVADRAAVRVRARQRGEVAPGHLPAGLRPEPGQDAGVGEPVERVDRRPSGPTRTPAGSMTPPTYGVSRPRLTTAPISSSLTPERGGHRQRGEDPGAGEPLDRAVLLERAQVGAAVVAGGVGAQAVVLQVDLDPLAVPGEQGEQRVVAGDPDAVGVHQDPDDGPRGELVEQLGEVGVERRLAAAEHERRRSGRSPGTAGCRRWPGPRSSGTTPVRAGEDSAKQVGQRRLQWSMTSSSRMQVCWVCISRQAVGVGRRHRQRSCRATSGSCCLVGAVHSSR